MGAHSVVSKEKEEEKGECDAIPVTKGRKRERERERERMGKRTQHDTATSSAASQRPPDVI